MPFTVAHALAVYPGVRWHRRLGLDPTCLVIGSKAPDFEYFAHGAQVGRFGHTWLGLVLWGVPATLVLAALWHYVVKGPALLAAPSALTPVFAPSWTAGRALRGGFLVVSVIVSAWLGNLTHVLWDGVTHSDGMFANLPGLHTVVAVPVLGSMLMNRVLQHASTLFGLAVLAWIVARAIRSLPPVAIDPLRLRTRAAFAVCSAVGGTLTLLRVVRMEYAHDPGNLVVATMSGMIGGAIVASLVVRTAGRRYLAATTDPAPVDSSQRSREVSGESGGYR